MKAADAIAAMRGAHHAVEAARGPGMVLCVAALVSPEGDGFSIKLEDQVLITESGHETFTRYPFDAARTGG